MSRSFHYHAEPDDVRKFVEALGYQVVETYNRDNTRATGFGIRDTTVDLSYDILAYDRATSELVTIGRGLITLWDDVFSTGGDIEKLERSRKLYNHLYSRFRRR